MSYRDRLNTGYEHQPLIQAYLQYQSFDGRQAFRLTRWLYAQVATSTVRPSVLFDLATAHLVAQRVVLPGVTVLARLIARVRERTGRHLYRQLCARLSPAQQAALDKPPSKRCYRWSRANASPRWKSCARPG